MKKTRKSISKRLKFTKSGKMLRRATGLNHYLAKKSRKQVRLDRKTTDLHQSEIKQIKNSHK